VRKARSAATVIGPGYAQYRDLSIVCISIICQSERLKKIIFLRDTEESRYFAITESNNCLIIRSPSLFSHLNHSLKPQGNELPLFTRESGYNYTYAE